MTTALERPKQYRRPGRLKRAVTYVPYRSYDVPVAPGTKPIWLYLRLSKVHKDAADAIERQRIDLTRQLDAEGGWTIMGEYVDNDSASISASRVRKGWTALNEAIGHDDVKAVAFWKLDRLSRVGSEGLAWFELCQIHHVKLISNQDRGVLDVKMLRGMMMLYAEFETDTMSVRQLGAKAHSAEAGFNHGGSDPFGWMSNPTKEVDDLGRSGHRLIPHPIEFSALQDAVKMVLDEGKSLAQIARCWSEGTPERAGIVQANGTPVYIASILRSLRSPRLMGYRMRQVPEHKRGVKIDLMDYVARDAHGDPVISQKAVCDKVTWMRLQRALSDASNSPARMPWGSVEWVLTGVMFCATCGHPLHGSQKQSKNAAGEPIVRLVYRCESNRRKGKGTCAAGCSLAQELAETYIRGWLTNYLSAEGLAQARAEEAAREEVTTEVDELAEARLERNALIAQQGLDKFRGAMIGVLVGLIADVQERIDRLERERGVTPASELSVSSGVELAEKWDAMTLAVKRQHVRQVIERIDVRPGRAAVADRVIVTPRIML